MPEQTRQVVMPNNSTMHSMPLCAKSALLLCRALGTTLGGVRGPVVVAHLPLVSLQAGSPGRTQLSTWLVVVAALAVTPVSHCRLQPPDHVSSHS